MDSIEKLCIIHIHKDDASLDTHEFSYFNEDENSRNIMLPLSQSAWEKIKHVADSRKQLPNYASSRYRSLIENLPAEMPSNSACGYHSACYSNFTAQAKAKLIPISSSSQPVSVPSFSTRQSTPSSSVSIGESSTGVLEKKCIICLSE